jgi:hypothetical protein
MAVIGFDSAILIAPGSLTAMPRDVSFGLLLSNRCGIVAQTVTREVVRASRLI